MIGGPLSLRISVTDACPLRCLYCRGARDDVASDGSGRLDAEDLALVLDCLQRTIGIEKLRFTGGEPLLRRDLPELVAAAAQAGIDDLALTTNGLRLAGCAMRLRHSGLRRVNISLDSLDPATFATITRGGELEACLDGIRAAIAAGLHPVKLNMVVLRGLNDHEVGAMAAFGIAAGCHVRFLELMPIGVAARDFEQRFVAWDEVHARLSERLRLEPLPYRQGSTSRDYLAIDPQGRTTVCGFITPTSHPFCEGCNRLRLTADGCLLGCLACPERIDLRAALIAARCGDARPLLRAVEAALGIKHQRRHLADQRDMARIGG